MLLIAPPPSADEGGIFHSNLSDMLIHVRNRARGVARKLHLASAAPPADPEVKGSATAPSNRHPAMRGIDVSPVHGRHCNCSRCLAQSGRDAA